MQYHQRLDREAIIFDCIDVMKGIYEIECSEGLILLGKTRPGTNAVGPVGALVHLRAGVAEVHLPLGVGIVCRMW